MVSALVFMADKNRKFHPEVKINSHLYEKYSELKSECMINNKITKDTCWIHNPKTKEQLLIKNN